jgi:ABC-type multidrug transport system permease subunit
VYKQRFPASNWYCFTHCLSREYKLMIRNTPFLVGRVGQNVFIGIVAGTLFSNLETADSNSMSGILFFAALFGAFASFAMMPLIFEQRAVFYKHAKGLFYPTWIYVTAQSLVMFPLMILETLILSVIVY